MYQVFLTINQAIQQAQVCVVPGCCIAFSYYTKVFAAA
jgi:hypothetical protein